MKRILMVDDVATNLRCATEILKDQYDITAVRSGTKAMEVFENMIPDLVLLDINMPGMSGFEVFERMKKIPELSQIPVVFLTAEAGKDIEARGRQMGASDFIRKPYEPDELSSRIEKVFQNCEDKLSAEMKTANPVGFFPGKSVEKVHAWADSESAKGYFILFNLERFEEVKKNFGSLAEEEIFLKIEEVLHEIPESDMCFCHVRNNFFASYIDGSYSIDSMKSIVKRMIAELEFEINESISEEFELKITVSAGIAAKPGDGTDYAGLWECADKALYFVKENGKKRYHFYSMGSGETKEGLEDKETINFLQLKRQFEGNNQEYANSRESLQKAYHIISKYWDEKEEIQIVFFSIEGKNVMEQSMDVLSDVITGSLRKGDCAVKCGRFQYIAVLSNASAQNGEMVARRIKKKYEERMNGIENALVFEMREM